MTNALNRKLDLLCQSGVCPPYLTDILSLLVAHANDTELFKKEVRAAGGVACSCACHSSTPTQGRGGEDASSRHQLTLVGRHKAELQPMPHHSLALQQEVVAAHESVVLSAERSLRGYAEDIRKMNDVALATAAKELRDLRGNTLAELKRSNASTIAQAVEQTRREAEAARSEWYEAVHAEAEAMKREVHKVGLESQREVCELTDAYAGFVAKAYDTITVEPLLDAHENCALTLFLKEQVGVMVATMASRAAVDSVSDRLGRVEKAVERQIGGKIEVDVETEVGQGRAERTNSTRRFRQAPISGHSVGVSKDRNTATAAAAASPSPMARLGVTAAEDTDGVVVTSVDPSFPAAERGITTGTIISHVGRSTVSTLSAFNDCIAAETNSVQLTTYDPQQARVRFVTIPLES